MTDRSFPNQEDIHKLEAETSRVLVIVQERMGPLSDQAFFDFIDGETGRESLPPVSEKLVAELQDPKDLFELFRCLELSPREGVSVCAMICDVKLEFWPSHEHIWIKDSVLRWDSKWRGDGKLRKPELFVDFLARRQISIVIS